MALAHFGFTERRRNSTVASQQSTSAVPFALVADFLIVVEGTISGRQGLKFAIDTGTARSVIDERVAAALAVPRNRSSMEVFGRPVVTEGLVASDMAFGTVRATDVQVLIADLASQQQRFGIRIDALVGVDVLRNHCFTIDFAAQRLTVECVPERSPDVAFNPPLPVVETWIDGNRYRMIVDSASEAIVVFQSSLPPDTKLNTDGEVSATHVSGTTRLKRFTPERFSVGRHPIGTPPVFVMSRTAPTGYDGVLGMRWLPGTRIYVDLVRGGLSWRSHRRKRGSRRPRSDWVNQIVRESSCP